MHNRQAAHITVTSLDAHRLRRLLDAAADSLDHEHFEGLEEGQKGQVFRYAETHDIGIYTLRVLEGTKPRQLAFSVNVDTDEADATKIDPEDLKERLGPVDLVFAEDPEGFLAVVEPFDGNSMDRVSISGMSLSFKTELPAIWFQAPG